MDKKFTPQQIEALANIPVPSTEHMWDEEKIGGVAQMVKDLEWLVAEDGYIAVAWALEVLRQISKNPTVGNLEKP